MKNLQPIILIAIIFSMISCNQKQHKKQDSIKDKFVDNGRLLDSISAVFNCEEITLDKWEGTDVTDSTFSISIINAKKIPSTINVDSSVSIFKKLAKSIKQASKYQTRYNSYQIIFAVTDTIYGRVNQIRKSGMTVSNDLLK